MILIPSTPKLFSEEVIILNSDPFFNRVSKDKDVFTEEEIREELQEGQNMGAERFVIQDGDRYVGVLELLMNNPKDGYPWLGLLQIRKSFQGQGYGRRAMDLFYDIMKERGVRTFRLGVIAENEPGHRFWKGQGMAPVKSVINQDGKEIIVYQKDVV